MLLLDDKGRELNATFQLIPMLVNKIMKAQLWKLIVISWPSRKQSLKSKVDRHYGKFLFRLDPAYGTFDLGHVFRKFLTFNKNR